MAIKISTGISLDKDPVRAAHIAVKEAMLGLRAEKIDLALVFSSIEFARPDVIKLISDVSGAAALAGASSLAVITDKGIFRHAIAVTLLSLPENIYFSAACARELTPSTIAGAANELGGQLLNDFHNARRDLALIFSDGLMRDGSLLLNGLQERLGTSFPIVGGSASDDLSFKKTYVYYNKEALNYAACSILWGGKLSFGFGTKHGWKAIGKPRRVTRASGNTVYEIDGLPAANVYKEYFGCDLNKLQLELRRISILYPIGIYQSKEEEYLLRNIFSVDDDGAIVFAGSVPEKSMIKLMIGTEESCLDATRQALAEARSGMEGRSINLALIFDSASRHILLGRKAAKELEIIKNGLDKDTSVLGLYTYGEQAPLKTFDYYGKAHFHNQSITILTMGG